MEWEFETYGEISNDDGPAIGVEDVLSLGIPSKVNCLTTGGQRGNSEDVL